MRQKHTIKNERVVAKMIIKLNTIEDVTDFVTICGNYGNDKIDVKQGRQTIDGTSILGIYSLNLMKPLDVTIDLKNRDSKKNFYHDIERWEIR